MSKIEELVYSAHEHGQRKNLLDKVSEIRIKHPNMLLEDVYDLAYSEVMNIN